MQWLVDNNEEGYDTAAPSSSLSRAAARAGDLKDALEDEKDEDEERASDEYRNDLHAQVAEERNQRMRIQRVTGVYQPRPHLSPAAWKLCRPKKAP